jgi:nucleotide-binding universal stress UspA family protein
VACAHPEEALRPYFSPSTVRHIGRRRADDSEGRTMANSGTVVVGVDDSPSARDALRWAADVASRRNWTLRVVHAWHLNVPSTPFGALPPETGEELRTAAEATLDEVVADVLGRDPGVVIERRVELSAPATALIRQSEDADLLVVGCRGRGGLASLALGSVSSACVHHAHCPVLVIRPRGDEHRHARRPAAEASV